MARMLKQELAFVVVATLGFGGAAWAHTSSYPSSIYFPSASEYAAGVRCAKGSSGSAGKDCEIAAVPPNCLGGDACEAVDASPTGVTCYHWGEIELPPVRSAGHPSGTDRHDRTAEHGEEKDYSGNAIVRRGVRWVCHAEDVDNSVRVDVAGVECGFFNTDTQGATPGNDPEHRRGDGTDGPYDGAAKPQKRTCKLDVQAHRSRSDPIPLPALRSIVFRGGSGHWARDERGGRIPQLRCEPPRSENCRRRRPTHVTCILRAESWPAAHQWWATRNVDGAEKNTDSTKRTENTDNTTESTEEPTQTTGGSSSKGHSPSNARSRSRSQLPTSLTRSTDLFECHGDVGRGLAIHGPVVNCPWHVPGAGIVTASCSLTYRVGKRTSEDPRRGMASAARKSTRRKMTMKKTSATSSSSSATGTRQGGGFSSLFDSLLSVSAVQFRGGEGETDLIVPIVIGIVVFLLFVRTCCAGIATRIERQEAEEAERIRRVRESLVRAGVSLADHVPPGEIPPAGQHSHHHLGGKTGKGKSQPSPGAGGTKRRKSYEIAVRNAVAAVSGIRGVPITDDFATGRAGGCDDNEREDVLLGAARRQNSSLAAQRSRKRSSTDKKPPSLETDGGVDIFLDDRDDALASPGAAESSTMGKGKGITKARKRKNRRNRAKRNGGGGESS